VTYLECSRAINGTEQRCTLQRARCPPPALFPARHPTRLRYRVTRGKKNVDEKRSRKFRGGNWALWAPRYRTRYRTRYRIIRTYERRKGCFNVGLRINNHCPFSHEIHAGSSEACRKRRTGPEQAPTITRAILNESKGDPVECQNIEGPYGSSTNTRRGGTSERRAIDSRLTSFFMWPIKIVVRVWPV